MTSSLADNSTDTAYDVTGSGPPLILIHGVGLDRIMWEPLAQRLAHQHTIVRYDLSGHGDSSSGKRGISLEGFVDQLKNLLDHLMLDRVALAGFSLGALIARQFALTRPDKLTRLVLISSVFQRSPAQIAAVQSRLAQAAEAGPESIIDAAIHRWFTPAFIDREPAVVDRVRDRLQRNNPKNFLSAYRIFARPTHPRLYDLQRVTCPTLVTTGALDTGSTPDMTRALAAALGNGRAVILPNLAHMAPVEGANAVAELLLDFMIEHVSDLHLQTKEE